MDTDLLLEEMDAGPLPATCVGDIYQDTRLLPTKATSDTAKCNLTVLPPPDVVRDSGSSGPKTQACTGVTSGGAGPDTRQYVNFSSKAGTVSSQPDVASGRSNSPFQVVGGDRPPPNLPPRKQRHPAADAFLQLQNVSRSYSVNTVSTTGVSGREEALVSPPIVYEDTSLFKPAPLAKIRPLSVQKRRDDARNSTALETLHSAEATTVTDNAFSYDGQERLTYEQGWTAGGGVDVKPPTTPVAHRTASPWGGCSQATATNEVHSEQYYLLFCQTHVRPLTA